jgi:hypothetical protein
MATKVEVWPKIGETYPDAAGVTITSAGAIVWESKYIEDAIRDGFLLTYDPLGIGDPVDHTSDIPPAPRDATYALVGPVPASLPNGRKLAAGVGIALADAGPGGLLTITATGPGGTGGAPVDGAYLVSSASAVLTSEQVLTAGAGISLTPGAGVMTIASTATGGPTAPSSPPPNVAASSSLGSPGTYATAQHTHGHGDQAGGTLHAVATTTVAGFLSNGDKVKIDAIPAAGAAPADAPYLVSSASAGLTAEQVLTAGTGITLTPAAGTLTIASSVAGGAPTDAQYLVSALHAGLSAERVLTAGTGVTVTPTAGVLTVATPTAVQGPASSVDNALTRYSGTTGKLVKSSTATLDDAGLLSTAALSVAGNVAVAGTVDGVDVGNLGAVPFVTIGASATVANERALTAGTGITITDGGAGGAVTVSSTVAGGAPTDAEYLVSAAHAGLSAERVLTAGANITLTPSAGALTIASTAGGGGAPTTAQYVTLAADATLTSERVLTAGTGITFADGGAGGALTVNKNGYGVNSQAVTAYALVLSDAGKYLHMFNAAPITLTIPTLATVPFTLGAEFLVLQQSAGQVTVVGAGGVTLLVPAGKVAKTAGPGATITLVRAGSDVWTLYGGLAESTFLESLGSVFDFNPANMGHDWTILFSFAGDTPISLPSNATYAWPIGTRFRLLKKNSGKVTISAGSGATVTFVMFVNPVSNGTGISFTTPNPVLMYQDGWAEITKIGTNEWRVYGVFWLTPPI